MIPGQELAEERVMQLRSELEEAPSKDSAGAIAGSAQFAGHGTNQQLRR